MAKHKIYLRKYAIYQEKSYVVFYSLESALVLVTELIATCHKLFTFVIFFNITMLYGPQSLSIRGLCNKESF